MVVSCFCNFAGASAIACCEFCINFSSQFLIRLGSQDLIRATALGLLDLGPGCISTNPLCELPNPIQAAQHGQWRAIEPIIRRVYEGRKHIPPEVAAHLAEHMGEEALEDREVEVLRLAMAGNCNREIANSLSISEETPPKNSSPAILMIHR